MHRQTIYSLLRGCLIYADSTPVRPGVGLVGMSIGLKGERLNLRGPNTKTDADRNMRQPFCPFPFFLFFCVFPSFKHALALPLAILKRVLRMQRGAELFPRRMKHPAAAH